MVFCQWHTSRHYPSPRKRLLVLSQGNQPKMDKDKLLGGFTLLPVGQEFLLPQLLATNHKVGHVPQGSKAWARRAQNDCSLCRTRVGPKRPASQPAARLGGRGQRMLQNHLIGCCSDSRLPPRWEPVSQVGGASASGGHDGRKLGSLPGRLARRRPHTGPLLCRDR